MQFITIVDYPYKEGPEEKSLKSNNRPGRALTDRLYQRLIFDVLALQN